MKKTRLQTNQSGATRLVCNSGSSTLGWRWALIDRGIYLLFCNPRQWDTELARKPRRVGRRPCMRRARPENADFVGAEFFGTHRYRFTRAPASVADHWLRAQGYDEWGF